MKKERLGKLCDFAVIHAQTFIPPKQSIIQQQKQAGAVAESDLVTAAIDSEFSVVEEKKTKDNEKGDFRRRNNQTTGSAVHKSKLVAQHGEDRVATRLTHMGPQMTRKRQKWQQQ